MFWGIDPALLHTSEPVGVWAQHATALDAFLSVSGQWNVVALTNGGLMWIGLNYGAALPALAAAGIGVTPDLWSNIQMIEAGAVATLNSDRMQ